MPLSGPSETEEAEAHLGNLEAPSRAFAIQVVVSTISFDPRALRNSVLIILRSVSNLPGSASV